MPVESRTVSTQANCGRLGGPLGKHYHYFFTVANMAGAGGRQSLIAATRVARFDRAFEGFPVAILNRNEPAFYCVPAKAYAVMLERLEDAELNAIADTRKGQRVVKVALDDL